MGTLVALPGRSVKKIDDEELSRRAAMWAATMRDDAASLREKARDTSNRVMRGDLLRLARALNRAAKIMDVEAGHSTREKVVRKKKTGPAVARSRSKAKRSRSSSLR